RWLCMDTSALVWCGTGTGSFTDMVRVPANGSITYIVSVPVHADSEESTATVTTGESAPTGIGLPALSDTNTLVILRDGYDVPYGDGTQGFSAIEPLRDASVSIEWSMADDGIHTVRAFQTDDGTIEVQGL